MDAFACERASAATAPGKAILFGEHSVVYGYTAVAACASDLRVRAEVAPCRESGLHAAFASVGGGAAAISQSFSVEAMRAALEAGGGERGARRPKRPSAALCAALTALITVGDPTIVQALVPLLYLSASLLLRDGGAVRGGGSAGVRVTVRSEGLPIGAGLGSSAAVSVATTAALLRASGAIGGGDAVAARTPRARRPRRAELELINEWAYASEVIFHGTPSGIDNSVSTFGGMLTFTKGDGMKPLERSAAAAPLRVLVTNTKVPRSTSALVGGVRVLHDALPGVTVPLFDAIEAVVLRSVALLRDGDAQQHLPTLMAMNQALLQAVGVSHPALNAVCAAMAGAGLPGTKLTGAGGGGCAITLLGDDAGAARARAPCAALEAVHGCECFETTLGGDGVLLVDGTIVSSL